MHIDKLCFIRVLPQTNFLLEYDELYLILSVSSNEYTSAGPAKLTQNCAWRHNRLKSFYEVNLWGHMPWFHLLSCGPTQISEFVQISELLIEHKTIFTFTVFCLNTLIEGTPDFKIFYIVEKLCSDN